MEKTPRHNAAILGDIPFGSCHASRDGFKLTSFPAGGDLRSGGPIIFHHYRGCERRRQSRPACGKRGPCGRINRRTPTYATFHSFQDPLIIVSLRPRKPRAKNQDVERNGPSCESSPLTRRWRPLACWRSLWTAARRPAVSLSGSKSNTYDQGILLKGESDDAKPRKGEARRAKR